MNSNSEVHIKMILKPLKRKKLRMKFKTTIDMDQERSRLP